MHLQRIEGSYYLEYQGRRIPVEASDIPILRQMTPLGRKMHFRNRAKVTLAALPEDPQASLLMEWFNLPAREWDFRIPEESRSESSSAL